MRNTKSLWRIVISVVLGGMALTAAIISYEGAREAQPDAFYFYLAGLFTWIFALVVFIPRPEDDVAYFSYLMSIGLMSVCSVNGIFSPAAQGWESKFVPLFQFAATALLPCVFLRCFAVFPSVKGFAANRFFRWWVYAPAVLLFIGMSISYLRGNTYERPFFLIRMPGFTIPNLICLFGYSIAGHACLAHTWLLGNNTLSQRRQAKWLFLGISIGTVPVAFLHTIPSLLGKEIQYGRYSAYTIVAIMLCYAVAIMKYRLMDIELVLNRSSVYAIVSAVILGIYLAGIQILSTIYSGSERAIQILATLMVALLFAPIKKGIQGFIDRYFYQRRYNYNKMMRELSGALSTMLNLDELVSTLLNQLSEVLQPEFAALLTKEDYHVYKQVGDSGKLAETLRQFDIKSVENEPERIGKKRLAIPLVSRGKRNGIILLGGKLSGSEYSAEDLSLMETLSRQAAISIENATIYEKLRDQIASMQDAHNRLIETFRESYPEFTLPEQPASGGEDIIAELDMIAEALIRSSEKLWELDKLKSDFVEKVSHELRNPLASIKGHADNLLFDGVLGLGELNEKQRERMEGISQSCGRLRRMVENLLDATKKEAGRIEFSPTNISLFPLINGVIFDLNSIAESKKKRVSLGFHCPSDLKLFADPDKLKQVIINLVDNAIKFTPPEGQVLVDAADGGDHVVISVKDTGIGIPPESLNEIFKWFYQVNDKTTGLGIGLYIVKSIVDLHGGRIDVQAEPGKGSQFTVILPKKRKE